MTTTVLMTSFGRRKTWIYGETVFIWILYFDCSARCWAARETRRLEQREYLFQEQDFSRPCTVEHAEMDFAAIMIYDRLLFPMDEAKDFFFFPYLLCFP